MKKKESLVLGRLLERIAPRIGAKVLMEPVWGIAGQITFKSGKRSYFRYNTVDLNPMGGSEIAEDKDYAAFFMQSMGYPIVEGRTFFTDEWAAAIGAPKRTEEAAYRYAKRLGFPVVVKPNSESQGRGVAVARTEREFRHALRVALALDKVALVQRLVQGSDYRIVVLDGEVVSAYERIPLSVEGDGASSVRELLEKKQRGFKRARRDTQIRIDDPRIRMKLASQRLRLSSVLPKGKRVYLLDNANLSSGGDAVDVTASMHSAYIKMAIRLTKDMGLRLCGVDVIAETPIKEKPGKYWILEVNSSPGLDHYVKAGKEQERIVEDLYVRVLKSLDGP